MYRETLDAMPCACCGKPAHGAMFFHGRCHPTSPVAAVVRRDRVQLLCADCGRPVAVVAVESPPTDRRPGGGRAAVPLGPVTTRCFGIAVDVWYAEGAIRVCCHDCGQLQFVLLIPSRPATTSAAN